MKILLLAYACEPDRGSEPGVGWNWVLNLAKDCSKDIHVLTRSNNRYIIDAYWTNNTCPNNLHFFYYDLSAPFIWVKHHGLPVNVYYALWLQGCVAYMQDLHAKYVFDMVHHITFGVYRDVCPIYKLKIPYVLGPLGGGEATPSGMMKIYSAKETISERIRGIVNKISLLNPYLHKSFNHADLIFTKTKETQALLHKWRQKVLVNIEIGINQISFDNKQERDKELFIFVGRFIHWKGVKLALKAFCIFQKSHPSAKILFIGKGNMESYINRVAMENKLEANIQIIPWISQKELTSYYDKSCAMVFPSLHDSSGNVVLEALSHGLPVVCLDCGGPVNILGDNLMDTVEMTANKSIDCIVNGLATKMEMLCSDSMQYKNISRKCLARANTMLWENTVSNAYKIIEERLSLQ
ncbi:MAG: glycosyltransferase family 4 protein [Prevotella sp.]|nr:glycosyltransferase family 4 protein [Prevotella sp.]